jgi:hypothetical protein
LLYLHNNAPTLPRAAAVAGALAAAEPAPGRMHQFASIINNASRILLKK